ncbi:hypothetical protein EVAR_40895_1 [Eumeta japonica]|uniref:Uncharacterized protein n=1 Tax=Eumeta variegata TaxID=151549 RepID=A0A4C1X596_EUMVA|nr:hypothetical protein EVAR_40895_1 [Eumeta japonica]
MTDKRATVVERSERCRRIRRCMDGYIECDKSYVIRVKSEFSKRQSHQCLSVDLRVSPRRHASAVCARAPPSPAGVVRVRAAADTAPRLIDAAPPCFRGRNKHLAAQLGDIHLCVTSMQDCRYFGGLAVHLRRRVYLRCSAVGERALENGSCRRSPRRQNTEKYYLYCVGGAVRRGPARARRGRRELTGYSPARVTRPPGASSGRERTAARGSFASHVRYGELDNVLRHRRP